MRLQGPLKGSFNTLECPPSCYTKGYDESIAAIDIRPGLAFGSRARSETVVQLTPFLANEITAKSTSAHPISEYYQHQNGAIALIGATHMFCSTHK
jgi:hypothetical protein